MINGFKSYEEIRAVTSRCIADGAAWIENKAPAVMSVKYKPKRTKPEEIKHQKAMLKEAKGELKNAKVGSKVWKRKRIRVSIVQRLLNKAQEK